MVFKIAGCAGHGGYKSLNPKAYATPGKRTPDGEPEWNFNNKLILAFEEALKQYEGVEFLRTDDRTGKTDVPLRTRTDKANAWKANIYVSFHHNANTSVWGSWTGVEVFYHAGSEQGKKLAELVLPELVKAYDLRNRGLKTDNLHITREAKMPAILIEGGFMDSKIDIKKLRDDKVLKAAGYGVAAAVAKYAGLKKKPAPAPKPNKDNPPKKNDDVFYRVITGSFSDRKNANDRIKLLDKAGFESFIDIQKVDNKTVYRVITGSFKSKDSAKDRIELLKKKGFESFIAAYKK